MPASILKGDSPSRRDRRSRAFWVGLSVAGSLLAWQFASLAVDSALILPGPAQTVSEAGRIIQNPDFPGILAASFGRIGISFVLALGLALLLGIPAGIVPRIEQLLSAPMRVMRAVPTMGIILLSLIWLSSEGAPLFVCTLVVMPLLYGGISGAIRAIDPGLIELHKVFPVPLSRRIFRFYIPAILPAFTGSLVAALSLNVKVMIAAEVLSQPRLAIGTAFQIERAQLNTPGVFAWCLIVILLSAVLDLLLRRLAFRRFLAGSGAGPGGGARAGLAGADDGAAVAGGRAGRGAANPAATAGPEPRDLA